MKTLPAEETAWAGRLASRLRVLQADAAADAPSLRLDFLKEEIERALHDIAPARRGAHLDALAEQFPDFAPPQGGESEVALLSLPPEVMVADLIDTAPTLPEETRYAWGQRLAEAGFGNAVAVDNGQGAAFELPAETRARLGLAANQGTDPERAARLCGLLIELTVALDQLAWSVWKQVAPQSIIRRDAGPDGDFRRLAARYLAGDPEVVATQVGQVLDRTRHLIAGVLAAIGPAGSTFARDYLARFNPEAISQAAAAGGGGGFLSSVEQRNWRKYSEMFGQISGAAIEHELLHAIAQYAETAILGPNRPPAVPQAAGER